MSNMKTLSELTIRDNFLFAAVMQQGDNCKHFLEILLGIAIGRIEILYEKSILYNPEYKGIRMDVYARDEVGTCYNVEMQVLRDELPRRSRYYHSQMDMDLLGRGEDYEQLPASYVIFICDFDPFGLKRYRYSFERLCLEDNKLRLQDGSRTIFLNTRGENKEDVPNELLHFLTFIRENEAHKTRDYSNKYVGQLQRSIQEVKRSREMGERFMLLEIMLRDEYRKGISEGETRGIAFGKAEAILDLLEDLGSISDTLRQRILSETDLTILKTLHKAAARATTLEQFETSLLYKSEADLSKSIQNESK